MTTTTTARPASPAAVAHRVGRLAEAAQHLLDALATGATLTPEQATTLRGVAALVSRAADSRQEVAA